MKTSKFLLSTAAIIGASSSGFSQNESIQPFNGKVGKYLAESTESWPEKVKAPKGAPNVIWILLDDVGFGASSSFGGLVNTPNFDSLANQGLRYTNFHTTGVSAPTRAALLTGRNHHSVHMGLFPHEALSAGFPGYDGHIPSTKGTIAENLRENGYSTYHIGKWHLIPDDELTDLGPFDRWPLGKGFDHSFGMLLGADDQYKTKLVDDNRNLKSDGRNLNEQLSAKAIEFITNHKKLDAEKPYFLYYATGATHSPLQVGREWIDKYSGQFDEGWDVYREKVFANQKRLGIIPADAKLPERNPRVKPWKSLSADEKKVFSRLMEAYAGYLEQTDYEIGRLITYLKTTNQFDNTAIFVMIGDNGASKGGYANGTNVGEFAGLKGDDKSQVAELLKNYDKLGTSEARTSYPIGWAQAANTPFRYWKQDANSEGGTHNPLIVSWPNGIKEKGGIRNQYSHVIDLLPTTLELTGSRKSTIIKGIKQDSIQGTSLVYSFNDAKAAPKHKIQHYFLWGAGAIYKDGWKAGFGYRPDMIDLYGQYPALTKIENNAGKERWELYNLNDDYTEINDLAKKNPEKLKELQLLFDSEAKINNVYPLINWSDLFEKFIKSKIVKEAK